MARALDNPLAMWRARRNIYAHWALNNNFLAADHKFDLEAGKFWPSSNRAVLGVAVVRVLVDVISLRRLNVGDAADYGVKACLRLELAVDENIAHSRCCVGVIFDFGRRTHVGFYDVTRKLRGFSVSLLYVRLLIFMCVTAVSEQDRHRPRAAGDFILVN